SDWSSDVCSSDLSGRPRDRARRAHPQRRGGPAADCAGAWAPDGGDGRGMTPRLDFFGIVVSDMGRSIAFYRRLGLEFPEGAEGEGHVEAQLAGGIRYALDTEEVMRSFDPEWQRPTGGHAV